MSSQVSSRLLGSSVKGIRAFIELLCQSPVSRTRYGNYFSHGGWSGLGAPTLNWWLLPSLRRLLPASRPRLQCLAKVARLGIHSRPRSPTPRKTRFLRPASRLLRPVSRRHRLRPRRRRLRPRSLRQCLSRVRMCASWAALASERNGSSRSSGWTSCGWWTSGSLFPTRADIQRLRASACGWRTSTRSSRTVSFAMAFGHGSSRRRR